MKDALREIDKILSPTNAYVSVLKAASVGSGGGKYDGVDCSNVKAAYGELIRSIPLIRGFYRLVGYDRGDLG